MAMVAVLHDFCDRDGRLDDAVGIAGGLPVDLCLLRLLLIRMHRIRFVGVGCVEAFPADVR